MAFTYDLSTNIGKVRLLIPDNSESAYYLQDTEIEYLLSDAGNNVKVAAVKACKWLARKFSQKATFSDSGVSVQNSARAAEFAKRASELEMEVTGSISTATLTRQDGYSEAATDSEYESRIVYIEV